MVDGKEKPGDAFVWLYDNPQDIQSVIETTDGLLRTLRFDIKALILSSKDDLLTVLDSREIRNFRYEHKKMGEGVHRFTLMREMRRGETLEGKFLLLKHPRGHVYIILTHEKPKFIKCGIINFFNKYYPKVSRTFIDSFYMKTILQNLEKKLGGMKIRSTRVVSKSRIISSGAKKKIESDVKWTDVLYEETFRKAFENDEWIKSIDFVLTSNKENMHNKEESTLPKIK